MKLKKNIIQLSNRIIYSINIVLTTLKIWKFKKFFQFWLFNKNKRLVKIKDLRFIIRTNTLKSKLVDLCVLLETIMYKNYNPDKKLIINQDDTIIDIGANIGAFSIFAAHNAKKGIIYAFEPSVENYVLLKKNIKLNNITNLKPINQAVAAKNGTTKLYLDKSNKAAHSINIVSKDYNVVKTVSLSNVFKTHRIKECNLLKLDCEGAEYEILLNTSSSTFKKINKIVCEYHEPHYYGIKDKQYNVKNLIDFLKLNKFKVKVIKVNDYEGLLYAIK